MKYLIEVELEQLKEIIVSLQERPYKVAHPIINSIIEQATKQETEVAKKIEEDKKETKPKQTSKKE